MKAPLQIIFPQPISGRLKIADKCPPDFYYQLNFAKAVHTSCDLGEFTVQSVEGTDYWLELWSFNVNSKGFLEIVAEEALVVVALFIQGNLEGELKGYGSVYTTAKTINLFYIPAGKHQIKLRQQLHVLLYFAPPGNSFKGMALEHPGIDELIKRQMQQHTNGSLLHGFALPKDAWMKLKRMETISEKVFALDLPLRQYMLELLNYYSEEMRRHAFRLPVNSSSQEKAVALKTFILANLHDAELGSITELAKRFYVSAKTLTSAFKLLTGMTVHQFIIEQRLERALQLLTDTQSPLIDIATASGFADTSHFIKRFKKKYGYTPRRKK